MGSEHDAFPRTLSLVTHELSTPLSVALGYLRMLLREQAGPINEKQRKMLEEAERGCSRIAGTLKEVTQLRKLISNEVNLARDTFDFGALVEELASGMHESRDRGDVTLHVIRSDGPLEVVGDRKHLTEAVSAVLRASLRERGEPGAVVVEVSRLSGSPPSILLMVGDEPVRRALRAETDRTYDEWQGGLGVARTMARRIVEAHGGAMWSTAKPDVGDRQRPGWSAGSAIRIPSKA
jgi:signal transduction histidine kinase